MSALEIIYASAPTDAMLLYTLEVSAPGVTPVRIVQGYEDRMLGVNGQLVLFEAAAVELSLPSRNASGQQTLRFGIAGANERIRPIVDAMLESGQMVTLTSRTYLASDITAPAERPYVMTVLSGQFENGAFVAEASYYDLLNTAWPRERYTAETAPGLQWL